MTGTIVWCTSCQTIVFKWDDSIEYQAEELNAKLVPCPECQAVGRFDSFAILDQARAARFGDSESFLQSCAKVFKVKWSPVQGTQLKF